MTSIDVDHYFTTLIEIEAQIGEFDYIKLDTDEELYFGFYKENGEISTDILKPDENYIIKFIYNKNKQEKVLYETSNYQDAITGLYFFIAYSIIALRKIVS